MTAARLDLVFAALADPTRRELLTRLVRAGPRTATNLAETVPMSRQAVLHHLHTLAEAGLVDSRREGREVHWSATTAPLAGAAAWIERAAPSSRAGHAR